MYWWHIRWKGDLFAPVAVSVDSFQMSFKYFPCCYEFATFLFREKTLYKLEFAAFGVCQAFCCLVSIGLQARFEKLQLIISRPAKGGELLGMKLATCCPLKTSCRTSHPGFRLRFVKGNYTGVALKEGLAEDGFDPSTSGLWAQQASAAPLCFISPQMRLKPTVPGFIAFSAVGACLAEDGFDPSTSGLWAQHASAAPLCSP